MAKLLFKTKFVDDQWDKYYRENSEWYDQQSEEMKGAIKQKRLAQAWSKEVEYAKARAYLKAIQDAQAALIRQKVQDKDFDGMPELQELMVQLKNKRGNGGNIHLHYFVTVNCKPDVQLRELKKKVEKYVRRKMVSKVEYVYEQRGSHEGEMGKGLHCHMLVTQRGDVFDGAFKTNTRNTFKDLVGTPDQHVDIKFTVDKFLDDKRSYMKGVKTQEGKAEKVAMDRVWRKNNNLQDYYTHENARLQAEGDDASDTTREEEGVPSQSEGSSVCEAC